MSKKISLDWKQFSIDLDKNNKRFKNLLSSNYDGLVASQQSLDVLFLEDYSQNDYDLLIDYWDNLTEVIENTPTQPEMAQHLKTLILSAVAFGQNLIVEFASENVAMGITQAGKTKDVLDYVTLVKTAIDTGSLYVAMEEIDTLISAGVPPELSPFVTEARLLEFKNKILAFLGQ